MHIKPEDLTPESIAGLQQWIIEVICQPGSTPPREVVSVDHFGIFNEGLYLRLASNGGPVKQSLSAYRNFSLQGRLLYQKMVNSLELKLKITKAQIQQLPPYCWAKERIQLFEPDWWPEPWRYMASCPQPARHVWSPVEKFSFKVFSSIDERIPDHKRFLSCLVVYLLLEEIEDNGSLSSIWRLRFEGNDSSAYAEEVISHFRETHSVSIRMLTDLYLEALAR